MNSKVRVGHPDAVHNRNDSDYDESRLREIPNNPTPTEDEEAWDKRRTSCAKRRGVKALNVESGSRVEILEKRDTSCPNKVSIGYNHGREGLPWGAEHFVDPMGEELTGEISQGNPFGPPAVGSTKPRTLSEAMSELTLRLRLLMVACFIPKDYEVVQKQPLSDIKEFIAQARELWDSYEPLLGTRYKSGDMTLQVEAPPELEDENNG